MTRTDVINGLIRLYGYKRYLEIGVQNGANFQSVTDVDKVGVDPDPASARFPGVLTMTSDAFFESDDSQFDIIFIDGLHLCWQVLRDVENALEHLSPGGTIVLHDVNPPTAEHAVETYVPGKDWNGTVWQAWAILRMTRPDLNMSVLDLDWGVGVIRRGLQDVFVLPYEVLAAYRHDLLNIKSSLGVTGPAANMSVLDRNDGTSLPVVVISYNQYTYVRDMVSQLKDWGVNNIVVVDNCSTSKELLDYYAEIQSSVKIIKMPKNFGHTVWQRSEVLEDLGTAFAITDPDLRFNPNMPKGFLSTLYGLSEKHRAPRVGLALSLDGVRDDVRINHQTVREWEARFWAERITDTELELYRADIDTTFCVVNRKYSDLSKVWETGIRVAGPYTCVHRPWMPGWESELLPGELYAYKVGNVSANWTK